MFTITYVYIIEFEQLHLCITGILEIALIAFKKFFTNAAAETRILL